MQTIYTVNKMWHKHINVFKYGAIEMDLDLDIDFFKLFKEGRLNCQEWGWGEGVLGDSIAYSRTPPCVNCRVAGGQLQVLPLRPVHQWQDGETWQQLQEGLLHQLHCKYNCQHW